VRGARSASKGLTFPCLRYGLKVSIWAASSIDPHCELSEAILKYLVAQRVGLADLLHGFCVKPIMMARELGADIIARKEHAGHSDLPTTA